MSDLSVQPRIEPACDRPLDNRPILQLNRNRFIVQFHQKSGQIVSLVFVHKKIVVGYEPDELHGGISGRMKGRHATRDRRD